MGDWSTYSSNFTLNDGRSGLSDPIKPLVLTPTFLMVAPSIVISALYRLNRVPVERPPPNNRPNPAFLLSLSLRSFSQSEGDNLIWISRSFLGWNRSSAFSFPPKAEFRKPFAIINAIMRLTFKSSIFLSIVIIRLDLAFWYLVQIRSRKTQYLSQKLQDYFLKKKCDVCSLVQINKLVSV